MINQVQKYNPKKFQAKENKLSNILDETLIKVVSEYIGFEFLLNLMTKKSLI
jgi:hypothetical protein